MIRKCVLKELERCVRQKLLSPDTTLCLEEVLSDYIYSQFWYPQGLKNELGAYFVRSWKYRLYTIYNKFRLGCHNGNKRLFPSSQWKISAGQTEILKR